MPKPYKHPNKRIVHRTSSGKFRKTTAADIGLGCCEKCGNFFVPDYSGLGPMVDPRDLNRMNRICPKCDVKE